jgi:hypothetical protein
LPLETLVADVDTPERCQADDQTALDVNVAGVGRHQAAAGVGVGMMPDALEGEAAMRTSPWMKLHHDTSDAMDSDHVIALLAGAPPRPDAIHATDSHALHSQRQWAATDAGALLHFVALYC